MLILKRVVLISSFVILAACGGLSDDNESALGGETSQPNPSVTPINAAGQLIRLPLYIWQVTSSNVPVVSSRLAAQDVQEYVRRVNLVWEPANIVFFIEQITPIELNEENAQDFSRFLQSVPAGQRGLDQAIGLLFGSGQYAGVNGNLNVVLMPEFGDSPGVAIFRHSVLMVSEFGLQNGIPSHNILAHELAHALQLAHVDIPQDVCNIMVAGSCLSSTLQNTENGLLIKKFNQCQIDIARNVIGAGFAPTLDLSSERCLSAENIQ